MTPDQFNGRATSFGAGPNIVTSSWFESPFRGIAFAGWSRKRQFRLLPPVSSVLDVVGRGLVLLALSGENR